MFDSDDLLAELPPPRDDEPASLRADIADELADHLACALHRELVKSGDAEIARQRVLDRFGNPSRIARQLWWQAMWSRIMGQRLVIASSLTVAAAAVVAVGFVGWLVFEQQKQMVAQQQSMVAVMERLTAVLGERNSPVPAVGAIPSITNKVLLKFQIVDALNPSRPVTNATVSLSPEPAKAGDAHPVEQSGPDGVADFAYVEIGRYRYTVNMPWGESTTGRFTLHLAGQHVVEVQVPTSPPERAKLDLASTPFPQSLKDLGLQSAVLQLSLRPRTVGSSSWVASRWPAHDAAQMTSQCFVILTASGRCWMAMPPPQNSFPGFGEAGGFGGMGGGFVGMGGSMGSLQQSADPNQPLPIVNHLSSLAWQEASAPSLSSGDYAVQWIGFSQLSPNDTIPIDMMLTKFLIAPPWDAHQLTAKTDFHLPLKASTKLVLDLPKSLLEYVRTHRPAPVQTYGAATETSATAASSHAVFRMKVSSENKGEPLPENLQLRLHDELGEVIVPRLSRHQPEEGYFTLDTPLHVGRYIGRFSSSPSSQYAPDQSSLQGSLEITIPNEKMPQFSVRMPSLQTAMNVQLQGPTAHEFSPQGTILAGVRLVYSGRLLDGVHWEPPPLEKQKPPRVLFGSQTGHVEWLEVGGRGRSFDAHTPPEDRFVTLRPGIYDVEWQFRIAFNDRDRTIMLVPEDRDKLAPRPDALYQSTLTIEPGQTKLTLSIPDDAWPKILQQAAKVKGPKFETNFGSAPADSLESAFPKPPETAVAMTSKMTGSVTSLPAFHLKIVPAPVESDEEPISALDLTKPPAAIETAPQGTAPKP